MNTDLLPRYTRSQLALRNGQDRPEIWCAYRGHYLRRDGIQDVARWESITNIGQGKTSPAN